MVAKSEHEEVIKFVRDFYSRKTEIPSMRTILRHFKKENLNLTRFYRLFPEGIAELCRLAGTPIPEKRIKQMKKAGEATKIKAKNTTQATSFMLTLTEEQTRRLLGVGHLENGKDPLLIIDELIEEDAKLGNKGSLLEKEGLFQKLLEKHKIKGGKSARTPNLIDCLTRAWNCGILQCPPESSKFLLETVELARARKWIPSNFVEYVTKHHNEIQLCHGMYKRGEITFKDFEARLAKYV